MGGMEKEEEKKEISVCQMSKYTSFLFAFQLGIGFSPKVKCNLIISPGTTS